MFSLYFLLLLQVDSGIVPTLEYEWKYINFTYSSGGDPTTYKKDCCMSAGVKVNSKGDVFVSVPRWKPNVPSTLNKITEEDGQFLLEPFPSWDYNKPDIPSNLHSVLGFEIDLEDNVWALDQGKIDGQAAEVDSIKLVKFNSDGSYNTSYVFNENIASTTNSFLNDVVLDFTRNYAYISDSGIPVDPSQGWRGGLIILDLVKGNATRILDADEYTNPDPTHWVTINGERVQPTSPMKTGADGIALSCSKDVLYFTPLTSRWIYALNIDDILDNLGDVSQIKSKVVQLQYRRSASDGLLASKLGRLYLTGIETNSIYMYNNSAPTAQDFLFNDNLVIANNDTGMVWPDTMGFYNTEGSIYFMSNNLQKYEGGYMDFSEINFRIWSLNVSDQSYLYECEFQTKSDSDSSFPIWAIILILLLSFILAVGIFFIVRKILQKRREKREFQRMEA